MVHGSSSRGADRSRCFDPAWQQSAVPLICDLGKAGNRGPAHRLECTPDLIGPSTGGQLPPLWSEGRGPARLCPGLCLLVDEVFQGIRAPQALRKHCIEAENSKARSFILLRDFGDSRPLWRKPGSARTCAKLEDLIALWISTSFVLVFTPFEACLRSTGQPVRWHSPCDSGV